MAETIRTISLKNKNILGHLIKIFPFGWISNVGPHAGFQKWFHELFLGKLLAKDDFRKKKQLSELKAYSPYDLGLNEVSEKSHSKVTF